MTVRNPVTKPRQAAGFTLVEMLTVIVIIGILAGLTTAAAIAARNAVRRAIIIEDMKQIEMGLQRYKSEVGEFPPDFANIAAAGAPQDDAAAQEARARVVRHLRKRFPRMKLTGTTDQQFQTFIIAATDLTAASYTPVEAAKRLNPSTALTFWLGGIPDADGKPKGFHEDPSNPFKAGEPRTTPYVDFNTERLVSTDPSLPRLQYLQPNIQPQSPYVYFRAVRDETSGRFEYGAIRTDRSGTVQFTPYAYPDPAASPTAENVAVPYLENASTIYDASSSTPDPVLDTDLRAWRSAETYQILAAGLDGVFSTLDDPASPPRDFRVSKLGIAFTDGDYDNLANFAEGELEDEL